MGDYPASALEIMPNVSEMTLNTKTRERVALGCVLLAQFLLSMPSMDLFFFQDDLSYLLAARKSISEMVASFSEPDALGYYRPVSYIIAGIFYDIFGMNHHAWHLLVIAIGMANTLLLYLLISELSGTSFSAILASLCYIVTNVSVVYVTWGNSNLGALTQLTFCLLMFLLFFKYLKTGRKSRKIWYLFFFALSLLTYEISAVIPILVLCVLLKEKCESRLTLRAVAAELAPFLVIEVFYLGTYAAVKSGRFFQSAQISGFSDFLQNCLGNITEKIAYLPWGFNLPTFRQDLPFYWPRIILGILISTYIVSAILFSIKALLRKDLMIVTGWLWFILFAAISIPLKVGSPHRIYCAAAGIAIILAIFFSRIEALSRFQLHVKSVFVALMLCCGLFNAYRFSEFDEFGPRARNSSKFFNDFISQFPNPERNSAYFIPRTETGTENDVKGGAAIKLYFDMPNLTFLFEDSGWTRERATAQYPNFKVFEYEPLRKAKR